MNRPPTLGGVAWKSSFWRYSTLVSGVLSAGTLPGESFISRQSRAFNEQRLKIA